MTIEKVDWPGGGKSVVVHDDDEPELRYHEALRLVMDASTLADARRIAFDAITGAPIARRASR